MAGGTITTPYAFTAGDDATSTRLNTRSTAITELQQPPRVFSFQSVAQTLTTGTAAPVTMDAEAYDTDGMHSTATNTSRLTVVTAGMYRLVGQVGFASNATGYRILELRLNGVVIASNRQNALSGATHVHQICLDYPLSVGQYMELWATQNSGGNLALATGQSVTFLEAIWVSLP